MAERIRAVFDTADDALAAVTLLQREGLASSSITVMSSEPLHAEFDFSADRRGALR